MDNASRKTIGAIAIIAFLIASWYFQRDKIDVIKRERDAVQKSGASRVAYQDCLMGNINSGNVEICEPLEEKMKSDAEEFSKVHGETSKALNLPE